MTLEEFATEAGVVVGTTDEQGWGGQYYYTEQGSNSKWMGHKTKQSAYNRWLKDKFGEKTAATIRKLLAQTDTTG